MHVDHVTLGPSGLVAHYWQDHAWHEKRVRNPLAVLRYTCELEEGTTLRDILRVATKSPLRGFLSAYSRCPLKAFAPEINAQGDPDPDLEYLRVYRWLVLELDRPQTETFDTVEFDGVAKKNDPLIDHPYVSVEALPIPVIADLPVKLDPKIQFGVRTEDKALHAQLKGLDLKAGYSLLDVLDAVCYEISFHGTPVQRERFAAELKARVAKIPFTEEGEA